VRLKFVVLDANVIIRSVFGVKVGRLMQSVGDDDCFLTPDVGVVKLKDDPNQLGTEITFTCPEPTCPEPSRRGRRVARIAWHLSYSDLTTPTLFVLKYPQGGSLGFGR
jgi:hypothetical protein